MSGEDRPELCRIDRRPLADASGNRESRHELATNRNAGDEANGIGVSFPIRRPQPVEADRHGAARFRSATVRQSR